MGATDRIDVGVRARGDRPTSRDCAPGAPMKHCFVSVFDLERFLAFKRGLGYKYRREGFLSARSMGSSARAVDAATRWTFLLRDRLARRKAREPISDALALLTGRVSPRACAPRARRRPSPSRSPNRPRPGAAPARRPFQGSSGHRAATDPDEGNRLRSPGFLHGWAGGERGSGLPGTGRSASVGRCSGVPLGDPFARLGS